MTFLMTATGYFVNGHEVDKKEFGRLLRNQVKQPKSVK